MEKKREESFLSAFEELQSFAPGKMKAVKHYSTGIDKLDDILGGGLYPGLTVLGAIPGMGKSTFALQLAADIAYAGHSVLFYSLEMPKNRVLAKLLNREIHLQDKKSQVTSDWLLREESWTEKHADSWEFIDQVKGSLADHYRTLYIRVQNTSVFSAETLCQDTEKFINETGLLPVVFVDYLQYLSPRDGNRSMTDKQKNDDNIRELKNLSIRYSLPVVVISSLNRDAYRDERKPLKMDAFKETGDIEYTAATIFGLQFRGLKEQDFEKEKEMSQKVRKLELVCLKQRYGMSGPGASVMLDFYPAKDLYQTYPASRKRIREPIVRNDAVESISKSAKMTKKDSTGAANMTKKELSGIEKIENNDLLESEEKIANEKPGLESEEKIINEKIGLHTLDKISEIEYLDDPRSRILAEFKRKQRK